MSLLQAGGFAAGRAYPVAPVSKNDGEAASNAIAEPARRSAEDASWDFAERLHLSRSFLADLRKGSVSPVQADYAEDRDEEDRYRAIARDLGVPYVAAIDPEALIIRDHDLDALLRNPRRQMARMEESEEAPALLMAPDAGDLPELRQLLSEKPAMARRLRIAAPDRLRGALITRAMPRLLRKARDGLFDRFPELSARIVLNAWQGSVVGAGAVLLPTALFFAPAATALALHAFFSLLFFSCVFLRLAATRRAGGISFKPLTPVREADLPVYTILVALYREAEVVPDLLVALGRIVWPRGKLEIKLVCEADDEATLNALAAQKLRPFIEVVRVPRGGPRTKPKALAYALQLSSGEFVALYDAEDRPHPDQLLEAWQRFAQAAGDLGCLQAPLVISNWNCGTIPRMFAFEYAALFRGLLPWLSRRRLMFPLGGTSNHFRRVVLDEVGGWDPYNVTEDADLGLKLSRFGYRSETISRPTFEDAPDDLPVWIRQRTRWFKGWIQTWLVHMRDPSQLARELGPGSFLVAQILFAGMVASALVHPLIFFTLVGVVAKIGWSGTVSGVETALLTIDALNIACGYLAFLILGATTLTMRERSGLATIALWTPVYWLLISAAAWRSVWQLYWKPHLWEKTPHRPHRTVMAGAPEGREPVQSG